MKILGMLGAMEPVDALLHPIRGRVVDLLDARPGTIAEIGLRLEASLGRPVPGTSLYRHVRILLDSGLVRVVETRPTDGAPCAVYGIDRTASNLRRDSVDHAKMMRLIAMVQTGTRRRFAWHAARLDRRLPFHRLAVFNRVLSLTDEQV
ncbi:MAG: helix-turn-helix domain-containing protein, partial [Armatimonadota bacterium]